MGVLQRSVRLPRYVRREDGKHLPPYAPAHCVVVECVVVAAGRETSHKGTSHKDTNDPIARVQKCHPVRGDERTKQMQSGLSRICTGNSVSSVRAQSAKCVTGQNTNVSQVRTQKCHTSEQRGSVEHIAL